MPTYHGCLTLVVLLGAQPVLTGECEILSQDIVYDSGTSLNPLLGIGQVEGCFVMAAGMYAVVARSFSQTTAMLWRTVCVILVVGALGHLRPSVGQSSGCVSVDNRCMTEHQVRSAKDGRLINNGTWDFKPPSALDIPLQFNVTFTQVANRCALARQLGSDSELFSKTIW